MTSSLLEKVLATITVVVLLTAAMIGAVDLVKSVNQKVLAPLDAVLPR